MSTTISETNNALEIHLNCYTSAKRGREGIEGWNFNPGSSRQEQRNTRSAFLPLSPYCRARLTCFHLPT
jgi:hypothetical protein